MADMSNPNEAAAPPATPSEASGYPDAAKTDASYVKQKSERNVQFNMTSNTVASYTPSDTSEEWDPNADDDSDLEDDQNAPEEIQGHLWKKSPNVMAFRKYQRRYFRVKNAKIHWWASKDDMLKKKTKPRGCLDLKANPADFVPDGSIRFTLQPKDGKWSSGSSFTGQASGRKFYLDSSDSEYSASEWAARMKEHIDYAQSLACV